MSVRLTPSRNPLLVKRARLAILYDHLLDARTTHAQRGRLDRAAQCWALACQVDAQLVDIEEQFEPQCARLNDESTSTP